MIHEEEATPAVTTKRTDNVSALANDPPRDRYLFGGLEVFLLGLRLPNVVFLLYCRRAGAHHGFIVESSTWDLDI